jgi:DNA-binding response OmpR family regulator
MAKTMPARLLVVDQDARYGEWLKHHLGVLCPESTVSALNLSDFVRWSEELSGRDCDVLMLAAPFGSSPEDPQAQGLELLRQLREKPHFPAVIAVAEEGNELTAVRALQLGAVDYLPKRLLTPERLKTSVRLALRMIEKRVARRIANLAYAGDAHTKSVVLETGVLKTKAQPAGAGADTRNSGSQQEGAGGAKGSSGMKRGAVETGAASGSERGADENGATRTRGLAGAQEAAGERSAAEGDNAVVVESPAGEESRAAEVEDRADVNNVAAARGPADAERPADTASPAEPDNPADAQGPADAGPADPSDFADARGPSDPDDLADAKGPSDPNDLADARGPSDPNDLADARSESSTLIPAAKAPGGEFMSANFIPGYTIHATIGESEKAAVYVATSAALGENVALKVSKTLRDETAGRQFLEREYTAIVAIRDPSVVQIHDYGVHSGYEYLVMEYLPRGDLKARMQQGMTEQEALRYVAQIAAALEVVHHAGLLHRDLKPPNVMLRENGDVALIDFGLARALDGSTPSTRIGVLRGSPYYMSPEQALGEVLDARSDFYSLGIMYYEMLTGKKPFTGGSAMEVLQQHVNAPLPMLPRHLAHHEPVLLKLMAKSREDRFATAGEILRALAERREVIQSGGRDTRQAQSSAA